MIPTELRHTLTAAKQIYLGQAVLLAATLGRDQAASLFMPWTRTDPYPVYEKIRARGQFASSRLGVQMVTSHRLSGQVLRSRDFSVVDPTGAINPRGTGDEVDLSLLIIDPPDHTRLRRVVAPAFSPRRLAQFETLIASTVADLLGKLPRGEPFDLIEHYAAVLPMRVIAELLGIPEQDRGRFRDWGQAIARALDGYSSLAHRRRLLRGQEELAAMFERLFEQRRHQPTDDAISDLVQAGDTIHPDEMVPLCTLLLVAGFETTVNLIGSTVIHLHRAGQWDLLTDDPALAQAATEETLRFDPPVQMTARWALSERRGERTPGALRHRRAADDRSHRAGPGGLHPSRRVRPDPHPGGRDARLLGRRALLPGRTPGPDGGSDRDRRTGQGRPHPATGGPLDLPGDHHTAWSQDSARHHLSGII